MLSRRSSLLLPLVLAGCGGALAIVFKLEKAVEKPVLPVKSIVGHDRHRAHRARGQREAAARQHQGAP